jgi:hypothetical protein
MMLRFLALTLALAPVLAVRAQSVDLVLGDADRAAMPTEALQHYDSAKQLYDHADLPDALSELTQAAEMSPNVALIQLQLAQLTMSQIPDLQGGEALAKIDAAQTALEHILAAPNVSPEQRQIALATMSDLSALTAEVTSREMALSTGGGGILTGLSAMQSRIEAARGQELLDVVPTLEEPLAAPTPEEQQPPELRAPTHEGVEPVKREDLRTSTTGVHRLPE